MVRCNTDLPGLMHNAANSIRSRDINHMSIGWLEAGFLGLLQGLTEFLPVSSSAHLRIAGEFLPSGADPGAAFTAITQIGTEAAVLVYFWSDIMRIAAAWLRQNLRLGPMTSPMRGLAG